MGKIVDLSVTINEHTPVYPGDPSTKIEPAARIEKDQYEDHYVSIGTHVGTHIDAPRHMIAGGSSLSSFAIDHFVGRGVLISIGKTFDLAEIKKIALQSGDIVLFQTGLSDHYYEAGYFEDYPAIPEDVAEYLVNQKVKMVGVDTCSVDHDDFIAHRKLLSGGVLIIENLTNLNLLEGKNFTVYALPLKLELDAAPARVIAQLD